MYEFDIKNYPLLKLALPLIGGIIIGWLCSVDILHIATLFALSFLAVLAGFAPQLPKWLFGVGVTGVMLAVGLFVINCDKGVATPCWGDGKVRCEAQLLEVPHMGDATTRALAYVVVCDSVERGARSEGRVDIYFANSVQADSLRVGEKICFEAKIKNPSNAGNPAEFDVARYMRLKGVSGSLYLPIGGWRSVGVGDMSLSMRALWLRDKIVQMYERLGFEGDELSLLAAFSVGEKRGFPQDLKEAYANAGVSHLLALSGLHLGLFYMVIVGLMGFVRGSRGGYILRELLALLLLWAFAFVAGLTPSVVRAAVLFTLVSVGRCLCRDSSAINSLAFAAVVMLIFAPRLLFDISFQLSFSAVFAILLITPHLQGLLGCDKRGGVYGYVLSLLAVSLAAQIGVLPFVWYYFGTFPLYFLVANLLLVPLATLLMVVVVVLWVVAPIAFLQQVVAWLLGLVLWVMNGVVESVAALPGASLMMPGVGVLGACLVALLLWLFIVAVVRRKLWVSLFLASVSVVALLLNIFAYNEGDGKDSFLLFNNRKSGAALLVPSGGGAYVVSSVPQFDSDAERVLAPYVEREGIAPVQWVENGFADSCVSYRQGIISFGGVRVQMLADNCWQEDSLARSADVLWLCRGFLGSVKQLMAVRPAACVILDGSLYEGSRRRLLRECGAAGVACVDISQIGAVRIVGDGDSFSIETMRGK